MEQISRLPLTQIRILLRLHDAPGQLGFVEGREEGGSVKELNRKGYIVPAGKVGRRIRWRLVNSKIGKKDIDEMRNLIGPVNRTFEERLSEILGARASHRNLKTIMRLMSGLEEGRFSVEKYTLTLAKVFIGIGKRNAEEASE